MIADAETIVIGAGVVGLAIARALAAEGRRVLTLERHARSASEVSQRSSEVIHAGLYYPPGSLKARLCREGQALFYDFAAESGVPVKRYGKLIVAADESDMEKLAAIHATARANGVEDLRRLSAQDAANLEPALTCRAALFSPSTGVMDSAAYAVALEGAAMASGAEIVFNATASALRLENNGFFAVDVESAGTRTTLLSRSLVIAAGLHSSALGRFLQYRDGYAVPETYFAKGHYFTLRGRAPFEHLIYPLPSGGGLGIHLTLDVQGAARFGPDIEWRNAVSYDFDDRDGCRREVFETAIRRFWPDLPDDALVPGSTGVRPKLSRQGEPAADFAIHSEAEHGVQGLIALYGIDSPGLTSSLAIGRYVAKLLPSP